MRWGGDEFVMLLGDDHALETVYLIKQELQAALALPYALNTHLSASVGLALVNDLEHPPPLETLIAQADQNMYKAKRAEGKP